MTSATDSIELSLKKKVFNADPLGLEPIPDDTRERFLQFKLLDTYRTLLSFQSIVEIQQLSSLDILPVPEIKSPMLGVYNWRSEMLWLADFNALVGNRPLWHGESYLEQAIVIVVQSPQATLGLVVEQVNDIELIDPAEIYQQADWHPPGLAPYIHGCLTGHQGIIFNAAAIITQLSQKSA